MPGGWGWPLQDSGFWHGFDERPKYLIDRIRGLENLGYVGVEHNHNAGFGRPSRKAVRLGLAVVEVILLPESVGAIDHLLSDCG
jgi:hypothetical protein